MAKYTEVTRAEYELIKELKPLIGYNKDQEMALVNFGRNYVNPHMSYCGGCKNSIADFKIKVYEWFNHFENQILANIIKLETPEPIVEPSPLDVAKEETKQYSKKNKKKDEQ